MISFVLANMAKMLGLLILVSSALAACSFGAENNAAMLPEPQLNAPHHEKALEQTAVFAGGCFWGVEAVFEHIKGIRSATSGYAGGAAETAHYEKVSSGDTGHAESIKVRFDPEKISYGQLLKVYFLVAHDPTQLNRQGPDIGSQYRSAIFYNGEQQKQIATAYIAQLNTAKIFSRPIVTQVVPLQNFYPAETYHQDYVRTHPNGSYIVVNDLPKVAHVKQQFPELYIEN